MIIVGIKGGLGNQMYQYALYHTILKSGKEAKLDISHFEIASNWKGSHIPNHGKQFLLKDIFDVPCDFATKKEVNALANLNMDLLSRASRKLGHYKKTHIREESYSSVSLEDLLEMDNVYLDGYWQDFSYSKQYLGDLRSLYRFDKELDENNLKAADLITSRNSVSIHVRRGDYLATSLYAVLDADYYKNAIQYFVSNIENPIFFCFSDDIEWCRKSLNQGNMVFIDWNEGRNSYRDMQLMSMCKHNIVSNSTFSMWAAWLNSNDGKVVIRPSQYYSSPNHSSDFPWPDSWKLIDA